MVIISESVQFAIIKWKASEWKIKFYELKGKQPGQQMYKIYHRGLTSFHKESTIRSSKTKIDTSREGHKRQVTETQWPDTKDGRFNSPLKHGCHTASRDPGRNKCLPRARGSRLCWGSVEGVNFAQYFSIQQLHLRTYPTDMLSKLQKWKKLLTHNLVVKKSELLTDARTARSPRHSATRRNRTPRMWHRCWEMHRSEKDALETVDRDRLQRQGVWTGNEEAAMPHFIPFCLSGSKAKAKIYTEISIQKRIWKCHQPITPKHLLSLCLTISFVGGTYLESCYI